jgi:hypothetical protein
LQGVVVRYGRLADVRRSHRAPLASTLSCPFFQRVTGPNTGGLTAGNMTPRGTMPDMWNRTARARRMAQVAVVLHSPGTPLEGPTEWKVFAVLVSNLATFPGIKALAWPGIQVVAVELEVAGARPIPVDQAPKTSRTACCGVSALAGDGRPVGWAS